jgi:hypothetical protein
VAESGPVQTTPDRFYYHQFYKSQLSFGAFFPPENKSTPKTKDAHFLKKHMQRDVKTKCSLLGIFYLRLG